MEEHQNNIFPGYIISQLRFQEKTRNGFFVQKSVTLYWSKNIYWIRREMLYIILSLIEQRWSFEKIVDISYLFHN